MATEEAKNEYLKKELKAWEWALALLKDFLVLDNLNILIDEKEYEINFEPIKHVNNQLISVLIGEFKIHNGTARDSIHAIFVPIEISLYAPRQIYPTLSYNALEKFDSFINALQKHIEFSHNIYEIIKDVSQKSQEYIIFFLAVTPKEFIDIKPFLRNCINTSSKFLAQYIANPPFMHMLSPIFKCEFIANNDFHNILNWSDPWNNIREQIKGVLKSFLATKKQFKPPFSIKKLKDFYYKIFLEPYFNIYKAYLDYKKQGELELNLKFLTQIHDIIYKQETNQRHRVPLDFLRTPVPFCFWDLINKAVYVKKYLVFLLFV